MSRPFVDPSRLRGVRAGDDSGFTVVEVVVAIALVTIVMTSLAVFFVNSARATDAQSQRQTAVQVATDAMGMARSMNSTELLGQRDKSTSDALWAAGQDASSSTSFPGVAPYLTNVSEAYDPTPGLPVNSGYTAPLPICVPGTGSAATPASTCSTAGATVSRNNVSFTRNWFIGTCWQAANNGCTTTSGTGKGQYLQVVVAVTWNGTGCSSSPCPRSYITSTLIDMDKDPTFPASNPDINSIADQTHDVGETVALTIGEQDGSAPFTWTAAGLPDGLSLRQSTTSRVTMSGTPTTVGTRTVTIFVTDDLGNKDQTSFTWTINPRPTVANPGTLSSPAGESVSQQIVGTPGTGSLTYSASGLPTGLSINSSTGLITGTPTDVSTSQASVTVVDARKQQSAVQTFTWVITPALSITTPPAQTSTYGSHIDYQLIASGGSQTYSTWTATGLPSGLTIDNRGMISGTPTASGAYQVTVTVTDGGGASATTNSFTWTVTQSSFRITAPTNANRADAVNSSPIISPTATGGSGSITWSATNLPTGMTVNSSTGKVTGTLQNGYRWLTTITARDATGATASFTFVWYVTGAVKIDVNPDGDRIDRVNRAVTALTPVASGGASNDTQGWSATGLPDGLSINGSTGAVTGTPTKSGTYLVTIKLQQSRFSGWIVDYTAYAQFIWTIS